MSPDSQGNVEPDPKNTALGLSVSPKPALLPEYRRPPAFGGTKGDLVVYRIAVADLGESLQRVPDDEKHELVQPKFKMSVVAFEAAIAATRPKWVRVEPKDVPND